MARAWLIDGRALARKVTNASQSLAHQIKDGGANRECPNCHCVIDNSDVSPEWPGLPAGVKFDPSDVELLEHLAAKCGVGNSKPHMFLEEFIPTLEGDQGIYYTHPENLPGAKKDGSSMHFFHRTVNAYATGQRKRRKIHSEHSFSEEHVRWHKTGKTKPVMENGVQKGCKKIMVLYKSSKKGCKPEKSSWVMHQYHLGTEEEEKEGEYVVSRVFYQRQKQTDKNDGILNEDPDNTALKSGPRTPKPNPPNPPRPGTSVVCDDVLDDAKPQSSIQGSGFLAEISDDLKQVEDDMGYPSWLAGESQAVEPSDLSCIDDSLLCKEIFDSSSLSKNPGVNHVSQTGNSHVTNGAIGSHNGSYGISDLENLELDTPPDFSLTDLQFGSQDSILDWLDRL